MYTVDTFPNPNTASYYYNDDSIYGGSYTYLTYDISSIGTGSGIISANLYLNLLDLYGDLNATVTLNGGNDNFLTRSAGWNAFDVKNILINSGNTISFTTTYTDPNNAGIYVSFGSLESGDVPYLEVVTGDLVPEPAAVLLFSSGLLCLAGLRIMKKRK